MQEQIRGIIEKHCSRILSELEEIINTNKLEETINIDDIHLSIRISSDTFDYEMRG